MNNKTLQTLIWRQPLYFLAFGFGAGLIPFAPGTFGTLAALPLYLIMSKLTLFYYCGLVLLLALIGIWLCDKVSKRLGVHDHPGIVWDEIVGLLISLIALPRHWVWLLAAFIVFRLFDIFKPWPIAWLDKRVVGGFGIMLDDVVAGVYTVVILQIVLLISH